MESTPTQSPFEMVDMSVAFEIVDKIASEFVSSTIEVDLDSAFSHIIAEDIVSGVNIPPYRASIMDGYAFKRSEYESESTFEMLSLASFAGVDDQLVNSLEIKPCSMMYVTTGSPVNDLFDTVIPVELTCSKDDSADKITVKTKKGEIYIKREAVKTSFIREIGSDISIGQVVLPQKTKIGASEIGLLASIGVGDNIRVFKKPKIGLAASGNEIIDHNDHSEGSDIKIRDSNTPMIKAILKSHGFTDIQTMGIVKDDYESIHKMFTELSESCDMIITTGGVSMGAKDLIKPYLTDNGKIEFGRLNMKPGKPTTFATLNSKLVFSLPGNPVSWFVSAQLFIIRALKQMSGDSNYIPSEVTVNVTTPLKLDMIRPEYHRVNLYTTGGDSNYQFVSTGDQQSSRLLSTLTANAFLILPDGNSYGSNKFTESSAKAVIIGEVYSRPDLK